mmetsp:Transcript_24547/g.36136  ORF Transcript_24547/g.36136 Transcript_24547/m.36136 type:complete len:89 (+) Transcript_24547:3839-4105(+)
MVLLAVLLPYVPGMGVTWQWYVKGVWYVVLFLYQMPHPERCFIGWQWPYAPMEWRQPPLSQSQSESRASPWVKLFSNAFDFCVSSLDM